MDLSLSIQDGVALIACPAAWMTAAGQGRDAASKAAGEPVRQARPWADLLEHLDSLRCRADLRAAVLVIDGRAGADAGPRPTGPAPTRHQPEPEPEPDPADVIAAVETFPVPCVAVLDQEVSGPALELALGCAARIATPQTRLALPDIAIGLIPGAGSTQRLTRLVGAEAALAMIATGQAVPAAQALETGLVDALADAAPDAQTPETQAPETQAPETQTPDAQAPETQAPDAQARETQARATQDPATGVPATKRRHPRPWASLVSMAGPDTDPLAQALTRALACARDLASSRTPTQSPAPIHSPEVFARRCADLRRRPAAPRALDAAIAAIERAGHLPPAEARKAEATARDALAQGPEARALHHLRQAETAPLADPRATGPTRALRRIGVAGGGTMGAGIAALCLMRGFDVVLLERDAEALHAATDRLRATLDGSARRGLLADPAAALARFQGTTRDRDLAPVDLAIEAVYEDFEVKADVFRRLDRVTRPDAILATNTSYLDVDRLAAVLRDPARAIGLHFFSPAHVMKLLEIVLPAAVAADVVATAAALARRLGKIAVLSGVCDGFIGNRIMSAYRAEADRLLIDGATPWQVDAVMRGHGWAMGIYEMQDLAGLDIAWAMRKRRLAQGAMTRPYIRIADRLCEAGRLGRKTAAGWYDHDDQGRARPSAAVLSVIRDERAAMGRPGTASLPDDIALARILAALRAEADQVLAEGIAARAADIDVVMVNGYGYPRWRGGPLHDRSTASPGPGARD
jgi:3-hydroxyacyl-CoA dehydrogenase